MIQITDQEVIEEATRLDKKFHQLPQALQDRRYMEAETNLLEQYAQGRRQRMRRDDYMAARKKLCEILRDPSQWPKGFVWNFRSPDNCAMGLARKSGFFEVLSDDNLEKTFGLTKAQCRIVFVNPFGDVNTPSTLIFMDAAPEDIARVLERVG